MNMREKLTMRAGVDPVCKWALEEIEQFENGLILMSAARQALKSYQYGNDSPLLATEIGDEIDKFLKERNYESD